MNKLNITYLLLGSNLGSRYTYLCKAKNEISAKVGNIITESNIYETEPIGFSSDNNFLNQVIEVSTTLNAEKILDIILKTELHLGRKRTGKGYSSRTIDIDILYFNNDIINNPNLIIPHPRIQDRKFTLLPLSEIAPNYIHPILKITQQQLLANCTDNSEVIIYKDHCNEA